MILCLCGAVERENFFWSREFGHVRLGLAHLTTLVLADVVLDFDGLLMTRWASNSQGSILPDRYLIVRRFRSLSAMDLDCLAQFLRFLRSSQVIPALGALVLTLLGCHCYLIRLSDPASALEDCQ